MGTVVQFTQTSSHPAQALSAIFESVSAIAAAKTKIEQDIRVMEAVLLNTQNPDDRALGLEYVRAIHAGLQLVLNDVQRAKVILLGHEELMRVADLQISNSKVKPALSSGERRTEGRVDGTQERSL